MNYGIFFGYTLFTGPFYRTKQQMLEVKRKQKKYVIDAFTCTSLYLEICICMVKSEKWHYAKSKMYSGRHVYYIGK